MENTTKSTKPIKPDFKNTKPPVTLYVSGLLYSKTEGEIKRMFNPYGKVTTVSLVKDNKTNLNKGIAFVGMTNQMAADKAILNFNNKEFDGRILKVSVALENKPIKTFKPKIDKNEDSLKPSDKKKKKEHSKRKPKGLTVLFNYLGKDE